MRSIIFHKLHVRHGLTLACLAFCFIACGSRVACTLPKHESAIQVAGLCILKHSLRLWFRLRLRRRWSFFSRRMCTPGDWHQTLTCHKPSSTAPMPMGARSDKLARMKSQDGLMMNKEYSKDISIQLFTFLIRCICSLLDFEGTFASLAEHTDSYSTNRNHSSETGRYPPRS